MRHQQEILVSHRPAMILTKQRMKSKRMQCSTTVLSAVEVKRKHKKNVRFNRRCLATPNLSGRDTPSSHISLDSTDRRTTSTNNPHPQDSVITNQSTTTNSMHNSLLAASQRGPVLPVVVQKPFRDDVPDKFNLFDLPQQRPTLEAGKVTNRIQWGKKSIKTFLGDETRSTISDNWSTMNAGVSEIDGQEQAAARLNEIVEELPIVEPRTRNELVLPENTSMVRHRIEF